MKKLIALAVSIVLILGISACGKKEEPPAQSEDVYRVGIVQLVEHPSLNEIRESIEQQLQTKGAEKGISIVIDYKNAQNDPSLITSICRNFVEDDVDVIVAIATPSAQGAAAVTTEIPIIFSAISDPVGAGLVTNLEAPEGNITGTSDYIDVDAIFQLAEELTPGIETFGLIYNKGEANSVSVIQRAKEYLDSQGIAYMERTVATTGDVQQAARTLAQETDAIFAPIDNTVALAMGVLSKEATQQGVPCYVAADSMVYDGGLATVGIDYTVLGAQTGDMVLRVLEGTPIQEIPVEVMEEPVVIINEEIAEALQLEIPTHLKED